MGTLKPGATYIYERADGVVYAREAGSSPETRKAVGWEYNEKDLEGLNPVAAQSYRDLHNRNKKFQRAQEWQDILDEAESNPALQKAVDRVKMIYKLSKEKVE